MLISAVREAINEAGMGRTADMGMGMEMAAEGRAPAGRARTGDCALTMLPACVPVPMPMPRRQAIRRPAQAQAAATSAIDQAQQLSTAVRTELRALQGWARAITKARAEAKATAIIRSGMKGGGSKAAGPRGLRSPASPPGVAAAAEFAREQLQRQARSDRLAARLLCDAPGEAGLLLALASR